MVFNNLEECFIILLISVLFSLIWFWVKFRIWKNSLNHICHWASPFLLPIVYEVSIGLDTNWKHQMIVNLIFGNSGVSGSLGSGGTASGAVATASGGCHPNLPLFLQIGQFGPHPHFSTFRATVELVVGCSWV